MAGFDFPPISVGFLHDLPSTGVRDVTLVTSSSRWPGARKERSIIRVSQGMDVAKLSLAPAQTSGCNCKSNTAAQNSTRTRGSRQGESGHAWDHREHEARRIARSRRVTAAGPI